ncbi:LysR family transcriptional regulator ArgP [Streptomyces sp. NPDC127106]|uniref:LysR family transcriptional regulator ArgP n=1 Tax=Streptomyces sp. NPDC127106 TaxID=3345360 RepID=UPI0036264227
MDELPLDQVRTLLAVVDEGTFDAAAAALHVTPSAVSQRVKALEQRTGRVLLMRTKPVRATESGQVVVRFARQLARLERDARAELGMAQDEGGPVRLPIAVNADSLATWFLPALTRVPQDPPVLFELHREDESHTTALLREGQVMAAVTSSPDPVAGCTVRRLGRARYLPVASPAFVARHLTEAGAETGTGRAGGAGDTGGVGGAGAGEPTRAAGLERALRRAPVIVFDRRDVLQDVFLRALTGDEDAGASPLRHHVPTSEGFCDAVAAGLGWGLVPQPQAEPLLRSGDLVLLVPGRPLDVPLYWQQWKLDSPALSRVADVVAAVAAEELLPGAAPQVPPGP